MEDQPNAVTSQPGRRSEFSKIFNFVIGIFGVVSAYIGASVVYALGFGVWLLLTGLSFDEGTARLDANTPAQFGASLAMYTIMAAIVYGFMKLCKLSLKDVGLGRFIKWSDIGWAIPIVVVYFVILVITMALISVYVPSINLEQEQQLGFDKGATGLALIPIFIALVIVPPIVEEFMIRGFLFTCVRGLLKVVPAALLVSFMFSVAHLQIGAGAPPLYVAAIDTFVLSLFLVYLRVKTGSIWASILVHALKNGVAFSALFLVK